VCACVCAYVRIGGVKKFWAPGREPTHCSRAAWAAPTPKAQDEQDAQV